MTVNRNTSAAMAGLHLLSTAFAWGVCLFIAIAYDWRAALIMLGAMEARVMFAVAIRTARMLGGAQ